MAFTNSRLSRTITLLITIFSLSLPAYAKYSGGTGDPNDPYQIATAADLMLLGDSLEDYDKHFILLNDIDLDPNLPGRKVFDRAIIAADPNLAEDGFQGIPFTGVFDGDGHTISHFTIKGMSDLGLFGQTGSRAEVRNLGLEDVYMTYTVNTIWSVGALVGSNKGIIANCYSAGTIIGVSGTYVGGLAGSNSGNIIASYSTVTVSVPYASSYVGGLVGKNFGCITASHSTGTVTGSRWVGGLAGSNGGAITTSYSSSSVSARREVGGLVGWNHLYGTITTSYSTGMVSGDDLVLGLVGNNDGSINASFWDMETSGRRHSGGTGLTTAEMQDISTFLSQGWDFVDEIVNGTCDYWQISPGDYPRLRYHFGKRPAMPEGLGTDEEPYLIRDARDLGTVWFEPSAHYRLEVSVDLSGTTWPVAVVPWFEGAFDGNGYVINNLRIQGGEYLGLFGQLKSNATVSDLGLDAVDINGFGDYIGGLAGVNGGHIISSYAVGIVTGYELIGGLVGSNVGSITTSYSISTVSGEGQVGGLVGENNGPIATSYSTGSVSARRDAGGLVWHNDSRITGCYSTSTVSGEDGVGGLAAWNGGSIMASHSSGTVTGDTYVGGLVGGNGPDGSNINNCYSANIVTGESFVGGLSGSNGGNISGSYSTGPVTGVRWVGGLVGDNINVRTSFGEDFEGIITASYSTGTVSGETTVGGLVGLNSSSVAMCYSTGPVTGNEEVGGLIGHDSAFHGGAFVLTFGRTTKSFWDVETSGQAVSAGGTGKDTDEMQTASTFLDAGWDLVDEIENGTEDIWWILEGQDYPRLWWEAAEQ